MENQKQGFGYFFDKSLRTLKNNLFVLVPNLVLYIVMGIISLSVMITLINSITNIVLMHLMSVSKSSIKNY